MQGTIRVFFLNHLLKNKHYLNIQEAVSNSGAQNKILKDLDTFTLKVVKFQFMGAPYTSTGSDIGSVFLLPVEIDPITFITTSFF